MDFRKKEDLRNRIMKKDDRTYEELDIPEWDEKMTLRSLTAAQNASLQKMSLGSSTNGKKDRWELIQATAAALAVVDPVTHDPVFSMDDVHWLKNKHAGALQKLWNKIAEMNGLTEADQEELKNALGANLENDSLSD